MALALGLENKRNVVLAIVLFVVLIGFGIYTFFFSGPPAPPPASAAVSAPTLNAPPAAAGAPAAAANAEKLSNAGIDPALHFDKLAAAEDVRYEGTGRNIFSAESAPPLMPKPIAPPRPNGANSAAQNQPPPVQIPRPPAIDLKYFGYEQDPDKSFRAFFVHGDDIFIARSGEIVDHRYKIGAIHPLNVEITDLSYNNTQTVAITQN